MESWAYTPAHKVISVNGCNHPKLQRKGVLEEIFWENKLTEFPWHSVPVGGAINAIHTRTAHKEQAWPMNGRVRRSCGRPASSRAFHLFNSHQLNAFLLLLDTHACVLVFGYRESSDKLMFLFFNFLNDCVKIANASYIVVYNSILSVICGCYLLLLFFGLFIGCMHVK